MATYTIENDSEFEYVKHIVITTDNPINLNNGVFTISIKELFEHFHSSYFKDDFEFEECLKNDTTPTLVINKDNLEIYQNSENNHLAEYGIQFYPNGNNELVIRVAGAGKNNVSNDTTVGFCVPEFYITLSDEETLYFKTFIFPVIKTGEPKTEDSAPTGTSAQVLPDGVDRVNYEWNDSSTKDSLYVNNSSATTAYKYVNEIATYLNPTYTQQYTIQSSAIVNDYLFSGTTTDIETSEEVQRDFNFEANSGLFKSYIYNEYDGSKVNIPYTTSVETIHNYNIVSGDDVVLSSDLHNFKITQTIFVSADENKVVKNKVKLEFEV